MKPKFIPIQKIKLPEREIRREIKRLEPYLVRKIDYTLFAMLDLRGKLEYLHRLEVNTLR